MKERDMSTITGLVMGLVMDPIEGLVLNVIGTAVVLVMLDLVVVLLDVALLDVFDTSFNVLIEVTSKPRTG